MPYALNVSVCAYAPGGTNPGRRVAVAPNIYIYIYIYIYIWVLNLDTA